MFYFWLTAAILSLLTAGCLPFASTKESNQSQQVITEPQPLEKKLGGSVESFDAEHERVENQGGDIVRYDDDFLHVWYQGGHAINVALQPTVENGPPMTQAEALSQALEFLPPDAVEKETLPNTGDSIAIRYSSELLASVEPVANFMEELSEQPGDIIIILQHEPGQPDQVFSVTVAAGSEP